MVKQHGFELDDHSQLPGIDQPGQRQHEQQLSLVRFLISQKTSMATGNNQPGLSNVMKFLDNKLKLANERGIVKRIIQIRILKSQLLFTSGRVNDALGELRQALSLAEHGGFFRIFLDEGEFIIKLLQRAVTEGIHSEYAIRLIHAFKHHEGPNSASADSETLSTLMEPMSERELQVLRLIAAGLSNREIAEELYLAVGTVKKHLYNIFEN